MADSYDYIIVGAGSAGCVLAERLSADGQSRVLLLEAGGENDSFWVKLPKGVAKLVTNPAHLWAYAVSQPREDGAPANEMWIRGKGLGGSSAINGMIWSRGEPADYDAWEAAGASGWNGASMTAALNALENHVGGAAARQAGNDRSESVQLPAGGYHDRCRDRAGVRAGRRPQRRDRAARRLL